MTARKRKSSCLDLESHGSLPYFSLKRSLSQVGLDVSGKELREFFTYVDVVFVRSSTDKLFIIHFFAVYRSLNLLTCLFDVLIPLRMSLQCWENWGPPWETQWLDYLLLPCAAIEQRVQVFAQLVRSYFACRAVEWTEEDLASDERCVPDCTVLGGDSMPVCFEGIRLNSIF